MTSFAGFPKPIPTSEGWYLCRVCSGSQLNPRFYAVRLQQKTRSVFTSQGLEVYVGGPVEI